MELENYRKKTTVSIAATGGLLIEALQTVVFAMALSVVVYLFIAIPNQVDGKSMFPSLDNGEILITNKFIQLVGGEGKLFPSYNYERGNIVVFQQPNRPDLVKRIIGMPGETIKVEDGKIYLNGKLFVEEYLPKGLETKAADFLSEGQTRRIPDDHFVLFGDNRSNSQDSRTSIVGFVNKEFIKGVTFFRITPFSKIGLLPKGESRQLEIVQ